MASKTAGELEKDVLETEWKECRSTVRSFDTTLTALRIYSLVISAALMGVSTNFFVNNRRDAAIFVTLGTIIIIFSVCYLERHYRGYLLVAVDRATALERRLKEVCKNLGVNLDMVTISLDCKETSAMISEVITKRRESYNWFMKNAHLLIYVFLLLSNVGLFIFFLLCGVAIIIR